MAFPVKVEYMTVALTVLFGDIKVKELLTNI